MNSKIGIEFFNERNFLEAAETLELEIAQGKDSPLIEKLEALVISYKELSIEGKELSFLFQLIKAYIELEKFSSALPHLIRAEALAGGKTDKLQVLLRKSQIHLGLGNLSEHKEAFLKLLEGCFEYKKSNFPLVHIENVESLRTMTSQELCYYCLLNIQSGDVSKLTENIDNLAVKQDRLIFNEKVIPKIRSSHISKNLIAQILRFKIIVLARANEIDTDLAIGVIVDFVVNNKLNDIDVLIIAELLVRLRSYNTVEDIFENYLWSSSESRALKYKKNQIKSVLEKVNRELPQLRPRYNLDIGNDLFSSEKIQSIEEKIESLKGKINFLYEKGNIQEAQRYLDKLLKIDPINEDADELRVMLQKKKTNDDGDLIDPYTERLETHESLNFQDVFGSEAGEKLEKALEDNFLHEQFSDVVVSLNFVGLHEQAEKFLRTINFINLEIPQQLNYWYLLVTTLLESAKYYEALDALHDVVMRYPLTREEKLCFMYLRAECLRFLGKRKEALKIYRDIKSKRPRYRLVGLRVRECEQS